ncbi:hypothetical protein HZH68_006816 [Vespula germanica]|uniref:C2H2-type domain-containing protein n=1 Tax=Vespula germanica TaxID=30212 RepID=A0A834KDM6_VESGE|nr:hypothetical protein HZH68_006816 [Vespula germanica]
MVRACNVNSYMPLGEEAASADSTGSEASSGGVIFDLSKRSLAANQSGANQARTTRATTTTTTTATTTITTTTTTTTTTRTKNEANGKMVASMHNLEDLGVSHPASASGNERQQQQQVLQEKHAHVYRSAQTAQDKRSRLSNVINNLRKKVPDGRSGSVVGGIGGVGGVGVVGGGGGSDSPIRKEEDGRNSVERNLETLEKYVMTVLNGVIKDEEEEGAEGEEEDDDRSVENKDTEKPAVGSGVGIGIVGGVGEAKDEEEEDEDSKGPKFEPSKPNESRTEVAVLPPGHIEKMKSDLEVDNVRCEYGSTDMDWTVGPTETAIESAKNVVESGHSMSPRLRLSSFDHEKSDFYESSSSKDLENDNHHSRQESIESEGDKRETRSLGMIIMERLDHQIVEGRNTSNVDDIVENLELRDTCRDLLNDLLNGIDQCADKMNSTEIANVARTFVGTFDEPRDSQVAEELSTTSFHCSLPLERIASVLQNCQAASIAAVETLTVQQQKFLSISLRQRHTERVHQLGGGRRSERNSRRPSQNCQYCSDKCLDSLEGLFHHMAGNHSDKYHACVQCSTRYLTREALLVHMTETHASSARERTTPQVQEKMKEPSPPCKEVVCQSSNEKSDVPPSKERRPCDAETEYRSETSLLKHVVPTTTKDVFSNPGSPEFDSSFYSSHNNANQIQFPIDISLTAATPVYNKDYAVEEYENSSEYAQKPGKSSRSHPRRVSFEKYNFPRKYDGKEQWTCSIKDLSKFDISTQLSLRKKQQMLKERITLNRLHQISPLVNSIPSNDIVQTSLANEQTSKEKSNKDAEESIIDHPCASLRDDNGLDQSSCLKAIGLIDRREKEIIRMDQPVDQSLGSTEFSLEFGNFMRLQKWDDAGHANPKMQKVIYAELTGEWSRPRIYICGACAARHVTLREMEDHKSSMHPNVWCSHYEFSGDQRELYKHLFLPGRSTPTIKAKNAIAPEKICTKCSKNCSTLAELHRHMLECGGDQAWLLGLFGNGKKKCKWRPFGSRSRRRRQRGMKRNIQNSQTPRTNVPREKQPAGPRVRPSDRESIQKMLANLPPKRATRKVLQDSTLRTQGRLRTPRQFSCFVQQDRDSPLGV